MMMMTHYVAKSFGKGFGFSLGLIFLPFVFYPILGFGDALYQYNGPASIEGILDSGDAIISSPQ